MRLERVFRVGQGRQFESHGDHPGFCERGPSKNAGSGATFRRGGSPVAGRGAGAAPRPRPVSNGAVCTGRASRGAVRALRLQLRDCKGARERHRADARPDPAAMVAREHRRRLRGRRRPPSSGRRAADRDDPRIRADPGALRSADRCARDRSRGRAAGEPRRSRSTMPRRARRASSISPSRFSGRAIPPRARPGSMSASPMRSPGCCARCRFRRAPAASSSRPISRPEAGSASRIIGRCAALRTCAAATAELAAAASRHLDAARAHRAKIPRSALPALLPAVVAQRWLTRLKRAAYDPFDPSLAIPDPLQSWRLAASSCSTGSDEFMQTSKGAGSRG